jgi:LIM-domain binding protein
MTLSLDGPREHTIDSSKCVIECVNAVWTYKYTNGYTIVLRGPLICHIVVGPPSTPGGGQPVHPAAQRQPYSLKILSLSFDANFHDKYLALDAIAGDRIQESPRARNPPVGSSANALQVEEENLWVKPKVKLDGAWIPEDPVNAFGIPQTVMRCLEVGH